MNQMFVGLDLGQASDFTAIAVLESDDSDPRTYQLRHLDRWRGVPYPQIVEKVRAIVDRLPPGSVLAVDQTGVGAAVVDLLRAARLPVDLIPISIHGGDRVTRDPAGWRVPKRDLVGVVSVLLESDRLKIAARLPHARTLVDELRNFRVTINAATAHDSYSAWREKDHDDLVLAAALACYVAEDPASRPVILTASSFGFFEEELSWGGD
jgi:phage FluMu gp28-like protein